MSTKLTVVVLSDYGVPRVVFLASHACRLVVIIVVIPSKSVRSVEPDGAVMVSVHASKSVVIIPENIESTVMTHLLGQFS